MDESLRNIWLAELLDQQRSTITDYWIQTIRAENVRGYQTITDEQLRKELPATVDSMIYAFQTGDTEGPRQHSIAVIQRRLAEGLQLPDLQTSLHALQVAVMRIVNDANVDIVKKLEALESSSSMYYNVALIAAAVYEQLRIAQQERFKRVYEFGLALSRNLDLDSIIDSATQTVAEYVNAKSVAILLGTSVQDQGSVRAYYSIDEDMADAIPEICRSLQCKDQDDGDIGSSETSHVINDVSHNRDLDKWAKPLAARGYNSIVCTPLFAKQRYLGCLIVLWPNVQAATDSVVALLMAMAGHIANAVQNAILYEEAQEKREIQMLLEASRIFTSSLNILDTLRKIARMATDAVNADLAVVFTLNHSKDGTRHIAYYAGDRRTSVAVQRIMGEVGPDGSEDNIAILKRELASGSPILFNSRPDVPRWLWFLEDNIESGMMMPLIQKNTLIGVFLTVSLDRDAFTEKDLTLATGLSDLASIAIENAQLYEYEHRIAETLQRSFLPSSLPYIEGYDLAAYYRPAMTEAEVGGDFYDVFGVDEDSISIMIGDVSGKGLESAIPTAMAKYVVRAYATEHSSPSSVMTRFNRTFYENVPEGLFMTAFYGTLDIKNNTFTYASAGHDPPLFYSAESGQVTQIDMEGLCLGVFPEVEYVDKTIQLHPGDVLFLYTDGATDVKGDTGRLDIEGLQQMFLSNTSESADQLIRNVSDGIWDYSHGVLADDVTLVLLKRIDGSLGIQDTRPPDIGM